MSESSESYRQISELRAACANVSHRQQGYEKLVRRALDVLDRCGVLLLALERNTEAEAVAQASTRFRQWLGQLPAVDVGTNVWAPPPPAPSRVAPGPRQALPADRPLGQSLANASSQQRRAWGLASEPVRSRRAMQSAAQRRAWGGEPPPPPEPPRAMAVPPVMAGGQPARSAAQRAAWREHGGAPPGAQLPPAAPARRPLSAAQRRHWGGAEAVAPEPPRSVAQRAAGIARPDPTISVGQRRERSFGAEQPAAPVEPFPFAAPASDGLPAELPPNPAGEPGPPAAPAPSEPPPSAPPQTRDELQSEAESVAAAFEAFGRGSDAPEPDAPEPETPDGS